MSFCNQPQPKNTSRTGYGPTSFRLQSPDAVFSHLSMHEGATFLDAGCGAGDYSRYAAQLLGKNGRVIALDSVKLSVETLLTQEQEDGMAKISGLVCDLTQPLPIPSQDVDIVLLSTVLHIKAVRDHAHAMFSEFKRILRPNGVLAVLECKKEASNFGPPLHSRLSANDVEALAAPCGFRKESEHLFQHSYLACFRLT